MTLHAPPRSIKRVLYVDDDPDSRELITVVLKRAGYDVVTSSGCREAARLAGQGGFDAIILDDWFPDGNGTDLCGEIRSNDAEVPILFFSAAAYPVDIERGLRAGAQAYLIKPNGLEEIIPTLRRLAQTGAARPLGSPAQAGSNSAGASSYGSLHH